MTGLLDWLRKYESVATWIEGIALMAIFGMDWWNGRADHRETAEQLRLSRSQAESLQSAVQSVVNSERAWILAELAWPTNEKSGPMLCTSQDQVRGMLHHTHLRIQLKLKNEGKTPGWIYEIQGHMEIISAKSASVEEPPENLETINGFVGPVGSGSNRAGHIEFDCPGHFTKPHFLSLHVVVKYRDIFKQERETHVSYIVDDNNSLYLQDALTGRNQNL
jgi:hypothetical protein